MIKPFPFILSAGCFLGIPAAAAQAGTFSVLYDFAGPYFNKDEGLYPVSVVLDSQGTLFGETGQGGAACRDQPAQYSMYVYGCGTVFRLDGGKLTTLAVFNKARGALGASRLAMHDGRLFGATTRGGAQDGGTVFSLAKDGTDFTTIQSFGGADGSAPRGVLRFGTDGTLYGVTESTLFATAPSGATTVLHSFAGPADGIVPSGILRAPDDTIYGATAAGGTYGCGTIYAYTPASGRFTTLYSLDGAAEGCSAQIGEMDAKGDIYGTAVAGGTPKAAPGYISAAYGTLFKLRKTAAGYSFEVLFTFGPTDGYHPLAPVRLLKDGSIVGTTQIGQPACPPMHCQTRFQNYTGELFRFKDGVLSVLYNFPAIGPGVSAGRLAIDPAGNIYGTANQPPADLPGQTDFPGGGWVWRYTP